MWHVLLTLVAGVLFALGWLAGKVAGVVLWCWSALAIGWDAARRPAEPVTEIHQRRAA